MSDVPFVPSDSYADAPGLRVVAEGDGPVDPRVAISVCGDLVQMVEQSMMALQFHDNLFQRAGSLVCVRRDDQMGVHVGPVKEPLLRYDLADVAVFLDTTGPKGALEAVVPPKVLAETILSLPSWPFRALDAIVRAPTLRADGSLLDEAGYDPASRLWGAWPSSLVVDVPEECGLDDADAAATKLLGLLQDFPFEAPHHRSAALAAILTVVARPAFDGPAPMFIVSASTPGTGKTLLCDIIGLLALGEDLPHQPYSDDEDEQRKRITATAAKGPPIVLLDNISAPLGGSALDAVLTSTTWEDRILGGSVMVSFPMRIVWLASGNNIQVRGDLLRRVQPIRLASDLERPEERTEFAIPDIRQHVRERRGELVGAALTILRAYIRQGRPGARTLGGFEGWSRLIRSAVVWVGQPDPCDGLAALRADADPRKEQDFEIIRGWHAAYGTEAKLLSDVAKDMNDVSATMRSGGSSELYPDRRGELWRALKEVTAFWRRSDGTLDGQQVAFRLRAIQGRVMGGLRIVKGEPVRDRQTWCCRAV